MGVRASAGPGWGLADWGVKQVSYTLRGTARAKAKPPVVYMGRTVLYGWASRDQQRCVGERAMMYIFRVSSSDTKLTSCL